MKTLPTSIQTLLILAAGAVLGLASNLVHPGKIAWTESWSNKVESIAQEKGITLVDLEAVKKAAAEGSALLLDARPRVDFDAGRIPGAVSLPFNELEARLPDVEFLLEGTPLITYCSGEACDDSVQLTLFLRDSGFTNVTLFAGGFNAWKAAGLETEGGTP